MSETQGNLAIPAEVLAAWGADQPGTRTEPWGRGRIHASWRVRDGRGGDLLVQRINTRVFPDPQALMDNVKRVTLHLQETLAGQPDSARRSLRLVPARNGGTLLRDSGGECWRAYGFIPGTAPAVTQPQARQAASAAGLFAAFQQALATLAGPPLHRVIPGFHDTQARYEALRAAAAADPLARAVSADEALALARAWHEGVMLRSAMAAGQHLPERVCHYDCKTDNVLFDTRSGAALCVVDLDTVMPGLVTYDIADLVRSCALAGGEDGGGGARGFRLPLVEAALEAYVGRACRFLSDPELDHIVPACSLITFELGVRFLTDYLLGDRYFPVQQPQQNLRRCRRQFALLEAMVQHAEPMQSCVAAALAAQAVTRQKH